AAAGRPGNGGAAMIGVTPATSATPDPPAVPDGAPGSAASGNGAPANGAPGKGAPDDGAPDNGSRPAGPARPGAVAAGDRGPAAGPIPLDSVERAVAEIAAGRPVVVVDDANRENEGDIIVAASKMTPSLMAFMIRHTSGVICVPLTGEDLDRLQLPLMTAQNNERMRTAFTVSVDARDGVTTGISAADRARTVRVLVDSATEPYE